MLTALTLFCLPLQAEHRVLGVGTIGWDYIQQVNDHFFDTFYLPPGGWKEMDCHSFFTVLNAAMTQYNPKLVSGGSVTNTIKGLAALGVVCSLTGNVGEDECGDRLLDILEKSGVEVFATRSPTPTSHVISLINSRGERSFCGFVQSERETQERDLLAQYFKDRDLVHIEGYLLPNHCVVEKAAALAKAAGATISYHVGGSYLSERYRERLWAFLSHYVDILIVDRDEAYGLTHLPPDKASQFLSYFCKIAVVKAGEKGCYVSSKNIHLHRPAIPTTVVDETCAGDFFAAGFLYGFLEGASLEQCALFGNLMGSAVIECKGSNIPHPRFHEMKTALR